MKKLAFIGNGHLANQIIHFIESNDNQDHEYIFFDDLSYKDGLKNAYPFKDFLNESFKEYTFCVSLGYKHLILKRTILHQLKGKRRNLLTFIHPTSHIDSTAIIDEGVIIYPFCNVDSNVRIKGGTLLNNSVTISHDSDIGESCFLGPRVTTSGFVHVGDCSFLGTGVIVADNIVIGEHCKIGIGSVLTKDVPDNSYGIGNPFVLKENLRI